MNTDTILVMFVSILCTYLGQSSTVLYKSNSKQKWQENKRVLFNNLKPNEMQIVDAFYNDELKSNEPNHKLSKVQDSAPHLDFASEASNHKLYKKDAKTPVTIHLIHEAYECLYGHNQIRSLYQCAHVQWDRDLAYEAEKWALTLALNNDGTYHSSFSDEHGNKYGENLYHYQGSDPKNCSDAIYMWYQEYHNYNFRRPQFTTTSGHFMQIVWDTITKLGVGIAYAHGQTWVVARYAPAENYFIKALQDHVHNPKGNPDIPISSILPVTSINPFIETVQIVTPPAPGGDCADTHTNCAYWESIGQCQKIPKFIKQYCPKICKMCTKGPPVNGGWTQWSKSSSCSALCGHGTYDESRFCLNPAPVNGGTPCNGDKRRQIICNLPECGSCTDQHRDCEGYGKMNYCKEGSFVEWMKHICKKTCNLC